MSQQAGKPGQKELPVDVWTDVCDILVAEELDGTAAALARTCRELYRVTTPKLFNTTRLRNLDVALKFFDYNSAYASALYYHVKSTPDLVENEAEWTDARTLISHLELQCVLPEEDCALGQPWGLPSRLYTCHLRTSWQQAPGNAGLLGRFVESIAERITAKHFRWEHQKHVNEDPNEFRSVWIGTMQDTGIASIQLPEEWQIAYNIYRLGTSILFNTRALCHHQLTGRWYTNPNNNEEPGTRFKAMEYYRSLSNAPNEVTTYLVQFGNPLTGSDDDPDRYAMLARDLAGTLTDFIVMEKMGLIHPKIVTIPDHLDPVEWRKWVMGEALAVGKGVQSELRDLVSRLAPGVHRRPHETNLSYENIRDLLTTVDLFVKVAFRKHGFDKAN